LKNKINIEKHKERCKYFRLKLLDISQNVTALHLGGSFSSIEILDFIYFNLLNKNDILNKRFILSKGHSAIANYVILNKLNIIPDYEIENYCTSKGILGCHPDETTPGITASTGSLGHGLALACGIAHFEKIKYKKNKLHQVYVVLSDGELQEGSTWEALMMAANLELNNLNIFLDHNGSQSFGKTKITHPKFYPISDKLKSFNWHCQTLNGHSIKELEKSYKRKSKLKPNFFICNTIKGKGVKFMENDPIWHYRSPSKSEYINAVKEIKQS
jgi:transketolase